MEWMNISYVLAFLAVFVASVSQILLKQSAEIPWPRGLQACTWIPFFLQ